jgi:signal recognition particle GTPase
MNLKLAKKLRKDARAETTGLVVTDYVRNSATNALELTPMCTRFYYKKLKKAVKHK